jgi:hypothetical protein
VDQPTDIPKAARSSMIVFSEFLKAIDRTNARNKLDPALMDVASKDVVDYVKTFVVPGAVEGIGSVRYKVIKVETLDSRTTRATFCLDQSKIVQVLKDGSHFVAPGATKYPRIKMRANLDRGMTGPEVTKFTFADGAC